MPESPAATDEGREEIRTLIDRRTQPGIVILNKSGDIVYQNQSAQRIMETRAPEDPSDGAPTRHSFLETMSELYAEFKRSTDPKTSSSPIEDRFFNHEGIRYLLRSLPLQPQRDHASPERLLILIEPIAPSPMEHGATSIRLTPREKRVVQLLLEGKTNKEVAVCMDIGEYTVKDHIKQIMRKLNVNTRAGVVSKVYLLHFSASQASPQNTFKSL